MNLNIVRSKGSKTKFFGGPEAVYTLSLKAEISVVESDLIKKYAPGGYTFDLPEAFNSLREQKHLQGPLYVTLQDLLSNGAEFTCKYLAEPFCALPQLIANEYEGFLARIRAREDWGGEETLLIEY